MNQISLHKTPRSEKIVYRLCASQRGMAVAAIILAFILFGVLMAAMVTLTSTSQQETVSSNLSLNAWSMAESGYRYVASYYRNTQDGSYNSNANHDDDKAYALENDLDGKTYAVSGRGSFNLKVMPYWFVVKTGNVIKLPGQVPTGYSFPASGRLKLGDDKQVQYYNYTGGTVSSGGVLGCSVCSTLATNTGESVYLVLNPNGAQTVSNGGNITLAATTGSVFPAVSGLVVIDDLASNNFILCNYKRADFNAGILTLYNLQKVDQTSPSFSVNVTTATNVVFKKFIKMRSKGQLGAEERTLTYYQTITDSLKDPTPDKIIIQTTADLTGNFYTGSGSGITGYEVASHATAGGGTSIFAQINSLSTTTGTAGSGGNDFKSGTFWYCKGTNCNTSNTTVNTNWTRSKYKLTYDVQVKLGTGKSLDDGAFGLSIRGSNATPSTLPNAYYGVSMMLYNLATIYVQNGSVAVVAGNAIRNAGNTATATIQGAPYVTAGTWGGSPQASATLRVTEVTGTFATGEQLQVYSGGVWTNFAKVRSYTGKQNDYIPDNIKPKPSDFSAGHPFYANRYSIGTLLLVLWEKKANGTYRWLAYKDITNDRYVRGLQDWNNTAGDPRGPPYGTCTGTCDEIDGQIVNDLASLLVRIKEDKGDFVVGGITTAVKYNDINVFYGDNSAIYASPARPGNTIDYDIEALRRRYRAGQTEFPTWPPLRLSYWSGAVDYFSHVEQPTGLPQFQWDNINPNVSDITVFQLLPDGTIRVSDLTTPDCTYPLACAFTYYQNEVGMHGFGDPSYISSPYYNASEGFADFSLRFYYSGSDYGGFGDAELVWE